MHGRLEGITGCKKFSSVGGVIQGWTTLKWLRTAPSRPVSARMLMGALADIWQTAADKVGKIRVIDDRQVCDLNQALAFHSSCQLRDLE
jgi:hypothetical protein